MSVYAPLKGDRRVCIAVALSRHGDTVFVAAAAPRERIVIAAYAVALPGATDAEEPFQPAAARVERRALWEKATEWEQAAPGRPVSITMRAAPRCDVLLLSVGDSRRAAAEARSVFDGSIIWGFGTEADAVLSAHYGQKIPPCIAVAQDAPVCAVAHNATFTAVAVRNTDVPLGTDPKLDVSELSHGDVPTTHASGLRMPSSHTGPCAKHHCVVDAALSPDGSLLVLHTTELVGIDTATGAVLCRVSCDLHACLARGFAHTAHLHDRSCGGDAVARAAPATVWAATFTSHGCRRLRITAAGTEKATPFMTGRPMLPNTRAQLAANGSRVVVEHRQDDGMCDVECITVGDERHKGVRAPACDVWLHKARFMEATGAATTMESVWRMRSLSPCGFFLLLQQRGLHLSLLRSRKDERAPRLCMDERSAGEVAYSGDGTACVAAMLDSQRLAAPPVLEGVRVWALPTVGRVLRAVLPDGALPYDVVESIAAFGGPDELVVPSAVGG